MPESLQLMNLPKKERIIILLLGYEELNAKEVSEVMEIPEQEVIEIFNKYKTYLPNREFITNAP